MRECINTKLASLSSSCLHSPDTLIERMKRWQLHRWPAHQLLFILHQSWLYKLHWIIITTWEQHLHFHEGKHSRRDRALALTDLTLYHVVSRWTSASVEAKSSLVHVCMCGGLKGVGLDECRLLEKVGAGRPSIYYSPCFMHSANTELFKGINMLKAG